MTHDTPPPEWTNMTDWSDLPHVYVTKAECQQGMFWRIEACSVPMAIGPEVRLITASEVEAMVAAALREAAAKVQDEANAANRDAEDAQQRGFGESAFHIRQNAEAMVSVIPAILALIPQPASAALDKLIAEAVQAERAIWTQAIETYFDATAVEDVDLHVAALRASHTTGENDD